MTNLAEIVVKADFKKEIVIKTHSLEMGLKERERERERERDRYVARGSTPEVNVIHILGGKGSSSVGRGIAYGIRAPWLESSRRKI